MLSTDAQQGIAVKAVDRMDGFDSNYILEEYMGTKSKNPKFQALLDSAADAIDANCFEKAEQLIAEARGIVGLNNEAIIALEGGLKRGKLLYEKNN
jgi:hypothetical protein